MMDEVTRQWLSTAVYALAMMAGLVVETLWLTKRTAAPDGRAIAHVLLTNILSLGISFGAIIMFMLFLLMLVFGPDGMGTKGYDALMWVIVALAVLFPPLIFTFIKRIFIFFLGITGLTRPWVYSVAASLLFLALTPMPAVIVYYLLGFAR
jgi:hypothetical protein